MLVDVLSIALKAVMYLALLQAAGGVFYLAIFESKLGITVRSVRAVTTGAAISCVVLTLFYTAFQAARMSGEVSGIVDGHLQRLVWHSMTGASAALRVASMGLLSWYGLRRSDSTAVLQQVAAVSAVLSLLLVGHTSVHPEHWPLALLLAFHSVIAAGWFGSLIPLALAARREATFVSVSVVNRFSTIAGWLVPGLAVAGLGMGLILTGIRYSFSDPYDLALTGKALGFSLLMGLAALNRWRLGPRLGGGLPGAVRAFEVSLAIEYLLVAAVVALTATMTSLYSPEAM